MTPAVPVATKPSDIFFFYTKYRSIFLGLTLHSELDFSKQEGCREKVTLDEDPIQISMP